MSSEPYDAEFRTLDVQKEESRSKRNKVYLAALVLLFLNGLILITQSGLGWKLLAIIDLLVPPATVILHWFITHAIVKR